MSIVHELLDRINQHHAQDQPITDMTVTRGEYARLVSELSASGYTGHDEGVSVFAGVRLHVLHETATQSATSIKLVYPDTEPEDPPEPEPVHTLYWDE